VGIDIERVREVKASDDILGEFFSLEEQIWVKSHTPEEEGEAFIRVWARREAASKATGVGLLKSFLCLRLPAVQFSPSGFCLSMNELTEQTEGGQLWWMRDLTPPLGHAGALCIEKMNPEPAFFRFGW
jgi:phosphopantetheinyl transferase